MFPECCDERLAALCSPELGACMDSQFGEVLGTEEVGQFVMLAAGHGILKVASIVGVGSGTVQRVAKDCADRERPLHSAETG